MTPVEMIAAVQKIFDLDGSEEEIDSLISLLDDNVPHAEISDLIYYTEPELSAAEIVAEALRREEEWRRAHRD